jgi:phospholipid N-methyltransferase
LRFSGTVIHIKEIDKTNGAIGFSSIVLSLWITHNIDVFKNKKVLELGCGVGLCGLTVSVCCQARSLRLTDCNTGLFDGIKENIERNCKNIRVIPNIQAYDWNEASIVREVSYEPMQGGYDVIIASDCFCDDTKDILLNAIFNNLNINGTLVMSNSSVLGSQGLDKFIYALQEHGQVIIERSLITMNKQFSNEVWMIVFTRRSDFVSLFRNAIL